MKLCSNCAQSMPDNAKFCPSCGTPAPVDTAHTYDAPVFPDPDTITKQQQPSYTANTGAYNAQPTSTGAYTQPSYTPPSYNAGAGYQNGGYQNGTYQPYGAGSNRNAEYCKKSIVGFCLVMGFILLAMIATALPYAVQTVLAFVELAMLIAGLVVCCSALSEIRRTGKRGRGLAIAGMIVSIILLALNIIVLIGTLVS